MDSSGRQHARIIDGDTTVSALEIEATANKIASAWLKRGVPRGAMVGVRLRPRHEWFILNRAISKIDGVHVALNWRLAPAELASTLAECKLDVLALDDDDLQGALSAMSPDRFNCLVHLGQHTDAPGVSLEQLAAEADPAVSLAPQGQDAPLVFFTSGTTGRPKGVSRQTGHQFANPLQVREYQFDIVRRRYGLVRDRRELLTLPLHHGMGPMAAQVCLKQGGTLHILRHFDPLTALKMLSEQEITSWSCVPTMLYRIAALPPSELARYRPTELVLLNVGAAPFPPSLKQWAIGYFGSCVSEGYGLTETGPVTSISGADALSRLHSCGKPYRHVELRIVDERGHECERGQAGVLLVKTPFLVRGYLTETLAHDHLTEDGYFKTGDMAYLDEEGFLYITGRLKDVIVSGGVKIFPQEVEDVLMRHPAVVEAAVIGVPDAEYGERVLAVCETRSGALPHDLMSFLKQTLSGYKRPREIHFVEALPRNEAGKVLKIQLRQTFSRKGRQT